MKDGTRVNPKDMTFSIIKHRGSPTKAKTLDGVTVEKTDHFFIENPYNLEQIIQVKCEDYHMEHFVYLDPSKVKGRWFAWCTCGSPAVIVQDEQTGVPVLACFFYRQFGRHVTGDGRPWS